MRIANKFFKIGRRRFLVELYLHPFKEKAITKPYQFDLLSIVINTRILKGIRIIFCHLGFRFVWLTKHDNPNVRVEGE